MYIIRMCRSRELRGKVVRGSVPKLKLIIGKSKNLTTKAGNAFAQELRIRAGICKLPSVRASTPRDSGVICSRGFGNGGREGNH